VPFKDWSLDKKLVFVYALMIIIPVIVVTFLGFQRYHDNLSGRVSEFSLNLTDQIVRNLDNYVHQIDRLSMTFYLDGVDGLRGSRDPMNLYTEKISIDRALRNMMLIIPFEDIKGIYWIRGGEVQYSQYGSSAMVDHSDFMAAGWYDRVLGADGRGVILPPYRPEGAGEDDPYIFSYARSIVNVANRVPYGVLLIDLSTSYLMELLQETKIPTSATVFIVDSSNRIIYHPDQRLIGERFGARLGPSYGKLTADLDGQTMVQYVRSQATGWTVVSTVPLRQLSEELNILRNLLWVFSGTVLLLAVLLSSGLTMNIIRPLKAMKRMMNRVELGDYTVRYPVQSQDEVGQLGRSFNHMVVQIDELVSRVLTMRIYQQQAEYKVLRSQINPHFLYNTLESINMKAELNGDYEVADMVSLLGKLFRLSLQESSDQIPLSRELEYVRVYMKLQQIRFPGLGFEVELAPELLDTPTLPWIVQPVVENAIVHGIAPARGKGEIRIRGWRQDDDLILQIEDDGAGVTADRLAEVNASLRQPRREDDGQHIGLYNVHRRIANRDGEGYGVSMDRHTQGWTIVTLRMRIGGEEAQDAASNDHR